jgi:hypothetical protein
MKEPAYPQITGGRIADNKIGFSNEPGGFEVGVECE